MFSDDSSVPSLGHLNDLTGDEVRIITRQKAMIPGDGLVVLGAGMALF